MCSDSWGLEESDTTERLNWTELNLPLVPPGKPPVQIRNSRSDPYCLRSPKTDFLLTGQEPPYRKVPRPTLGRIWWLR